MSKECSDRPARRTTRERNLHIRLGTSGCNSYFESFVCRPVYSAKRNISPERCAEAAPERSDTVRVRHFAHTVERGAECVGFSGVWRCRLESGAKKFERRCYTGDERPCGDACYERMQGGRDDRRDVRWDGV